eukprot:TRINITY_DN103125_c0_g1_i1.p2 TRINITY_DN103125_c0_g1~~TRINITY_DN103125_c0_g1_i1.p2  ORF type:complete len:195 (+),score=24.00 TRINITY_DN103125_c0_g1_i1:202-786(+)
MSSKGVIDFLQLMSNLKKTKRQGWVIRNIKEPESIADHMYRMAAACFALKGKVKVDHSHCIKIAIVHDMAESIVGDFTPHCPISKEEKHRLEKEAIERIQELLGRDSEGAKEVGQLWKEYENGETSEARIVKDLDKLEMILQAYEYEKDHGEDLQEFFDSTEDSFRTEIGMQWAEEVRSRRNSCIQNGSMSNVQ